MSDAAGAGPWSDDGKALEKIFSFKDFRAAFAFMQRVAFECEAMDHHPEWTNTYNWVRIKLWTHTSGGITELDRELAKRIDAIAAEG